MSSPISDLEPHHEQAAIPELVERAFGNLYWTPERLENFLNDRLNRNRQHIAKRGGEGSASLGV